MIRTVKRITALAVVMLSFGVMGAIAQPTGPPGPPGGGGGTPPCWPPPCIPVDGGASLLIAAGIAFGAKKVYDLNK